MADLDPQARTVTVGDRSVEVMQWGTGPAEIVMLHDGLGSISQWRDVPHRIAVATGQSVLAYNRAGHGGSTPVPDQHWPADWLHAEAAWLNEFLEALGLERPVLVGHSDGASIALLAAAQPTNDAGPVASAIVSLAAHSYVEGVCVNAIVAMRKDRDPILSGLRKHHQHADRIFEAWSGVWTSQEFRRWDIRDNLNAVSIPVLVVQGDADEYGTDAMARDTAVAIGSNADLRLLPGIGHLIHHQAANEVVELVAEVATGAV